MHTRYFDLMSSDAGFNYRWVQPPQVTYLVCTLDAHGNHNITPVTLGTCVGVNSLSNPEQSNYYYAFSVGSVDIPNIPARQAFHNLETLPECVISYPGSNLMERIWVTALPFPAGIEEMDVAGLKPLPSNAVEPHGIAECPINMEAKIQSSCPVGDHFRLFICQIVGVSVHEALVAQDDQNPLRFGMLAIDPLLETTIVIEGKNPPRLYFGKIDREHLIRTPDDMGSSKKWIGTFEEWIQDEFQRGKIDASERKRIVELFQIWKACPDPRTNGSVKKELAGMLREMVWTRR